MKKISAALLCGLAVILLTAVLYFTILGEILLTVVHGIALTGILLAEAITTAYACFAKGNPRRVAAAVVSGFMIPFAAILSLVYVLNFPMGYATYVGWYCAGMIVINLVAFVIIRFDSKKSEGSARFQDAKSNMLSLRKLVMCILADPAAKKHEKQLRALEETLHFSNDSVISADDENIRLMLLRLQENIASPDFNDEIFGEIEKAIKTRNYNVNG